MRTCTKVHSTSFIDSRANDSLRLRNLTVNESLIPALEKSSETWDMTTSRLQSPPSASPLVLRLYKSGNSQPLLRSYNFLVSPIPHPKSASTGQPLGTIDLTRSFSLSEQVSVCRICLESDPEDRLISPCECKGSLLFVHVECLQAWLIKGTRPTASLTECEVCKYRYKMRFSYTTQFRPCGSEKECSLWRPFSFFLMNVVILIALIVAWQSGDFIDQSMAVAFGSISSFGALLFLLITLTRVRDLWFIRNIVGWEIDPKTE